MSRFQLTLRGQPVPARIWFGVLWRMLFLICWTTGCLLLLRLLIWWLTGW